MFRQSARLRALLAAGGVVVAVAAIAIGVSLFHSAPPAHHLASSEHKVTATRAAQVPASSAGSASTASPADSVGTGQPPGQVAPQVPAVSSVPQVPAADPSPTGTQAPAPAALSSCSTLGDTTTDSGGALVQCAGSAGSSLWECDPNNAGPSTYLPVPGQAAPPSGWPVVLDVDGSAYVADVEVSSGVWEWQVTAPPC